MISNFDNSGLETANKLLQQGKIQEAITEYRHCVKSIPDLSWSHYYLGDILTRLEDWEWAAEAYRQAVALGANYLCYYRLGVALVQLERWDEAVEVFNRGLKLNPSYDKFYLQLGPALIHKQDWQTAIDAYEKAIALKPVEPEFNLRLGQLLLQQARFQEALGYLEWSVNFNSDDPQLQLGLGMALVETGNDLNRAEACLRRSLELEPDQPKGYFYLGKLCRQQGRFYEASGFYRSSWELSQELDCGFALAEVLGQLGRWSEAVEEYRQVIFKFGDSGRALFGLGQALVALDRPLEAVVEWRRAVGLGWNTPELHSGLAETLVGLGVWDEVVIAWDKLLAVQAGNVGVRRRLALALMGLGRWLDAKSQWQKYLQVAPGGSQGALIDFRPMLGMYGEIPHSENLSIQGDLTVELWLYLRQWPDGWTNIVGKLVNDQQNEFCLRLKNGEEGQWYYGEGDRCVNPLRWIPKDKIPLHQWVHIACVRKVGEYGQLYIDGVLQGERHWGTHLEAMQTEAPVRLMVSSNRQQFLDGMLSDVRVWQVARTGDEIRQGMYERMMARETGLVAVWYGAEEMDLVDIVGKHHGKIMRILDAGKPRPKVGISAGEFSDNRTERVNTLAQLYGGFAEVELVECLLPEQAEQVWEINIPCHTIRVKDEGLFVEQAVAWVLAHPYAVVHLSYAQMPNIILGLLYKVLWDARVIVDEDESSLVPTKEVVNLEADLPQLVDLVGEKWNRLAKFLVKGFDGLINLHEASIGTAEVGESFVRLVTKVLTQPSCDLSDGFDGLINLHEASIGTAEVGESFVRLVTKVLTQPSCDLSDGLAWLLERLPAFESVWLKLRWEMEKVDKTQLVSSQVTMLERLDDRDFQRNKYPSNVAVYTTATNVLWQEKKEMSPGDISKLLDPLYHWYLKIDENPDNPWLYWRLGNALVSNNLLDHAIIFYKMGLKLSPNNYELNLQLGKVLLAKNKCDRALEYLIKAQEVEPKSFEVNLNLAIALEKLNRSDQAVLSYKKAFLVNPGNYFVVKQLASIWEIQGKHQDVIELYREVLERGYGNSGNDDHSGLDVVKTGFNKSVLFALHLSLPYEGTGYAVRSQHILKLLHHHGLKVLAATRWGYPKKLLKYHDSLIPPWDELEKIRYCRLGIGKSDLSGHDWGYKFIEEYAEGLMKLAHSHQAMVIHGSSTFVNGLASVLAAKKLGVKSVYEIRGLWHLSKVAREPEFKYSHQFFYQEMMEILVAQQADSVVVLSEVLKEKVVSWGVSSNKITVVPNAVDLKEFYPRVADSNLQRKFGLAGNFVIGFLGTLNSYEGVDILIKAMQGLFEEGHKIVLMIVGDGLALQDLQALSLSGSGKENIIFTGRVPFSQMLDYYSVCDLCVFPRRDDEVCRYVPPLKVLEPMAMAKPVIVSNLPPLVEMVEDEKTGLVFRCGDVESLRTKILRLYHEQELRMSLGKEARNWVERYRSWNEVSKKYLGIYESLFAVRSR